MAEPSLRTQSASHLSADATPGAADLPSWQAVVSVNAVAQFTLNGKLVWANERYLALFGYSNSEAIGRCHRRFHASQRPGSSGADPFWDRLSAGEIQNDLFVYCGKDGEDRWIEATYLPVRKNGVVTRVLKMARDVTDRVERENAAHENTRQLSLAANSTDNAVLITDSRWRIIYVNQGLVRKLQWQPHELLGRSPVALFSPHADPRVERAYRRDLIEGRDVRREAILCSKDQKRYLCSIVASPVIEDGRVVKTVTVITDITQSKVHETLHKSVLEAIVHERPLLEVMGMICTGIEQMLPDMTAATLEADPDGMLHLLSAPRLPFEALQRYSGCVRWPIARRAGHRDDALVQFDLEAQPEVGLFEDLRKLGYITVWGLPVLNADDCLIGAVVLHSRHAQPLDGFQQDLMKAAAGLCSLALTRERAKAQIRQLAFYDGLTQLPNRSLLYIQAEQAIEAARRDAKQVAVVFIDLDRFKHINDSLGHAAGNELLQRVADHIAESQRRSDIASRLSGDEFVLVLPGCNARGAAEVIERLQSRLAQPLALAGKQVQSSASIGIAMFPHDGNDIDTLLQRAEMAMCQAKVEVRSKYAFFRHELNVEAQERLAMEDALRCALRSDQLTLHYQPQVSLATGRLYGVEALARWHDPQLGWVPPSRFVPLAEACGMIGELGYWALDRACAQLAEWRAAGLSVPSVSVNLSATNFHDRDLPAYTAATLAKHGLEASSLMMEITEGVFMDEHPATTSTIAALHTMGVKLSMDDFGSGYSSLSYLSRLPISELKLDRSFICNLDTDPTSQALSKAVAQIGSALGLTLVAEGVETPAQRALLSEQGYHIEQGYLLSRPLAAAAMAAWLRAESIASDALHHPA